MAFPTTSLLDNFNRANENPLGGIWQNASLGVSEAKMKIVTNQCLPNGDPSGQATTATYAANEEVWATVVSNTGAQYDGVYVYTRVVSPGTSSLRGYRFGIYSIGSSTYGSINRQDDPGVPVVPLTGDILTNWVPGDKIGFSSIGNVHTAYIFHAGVWSQVAQVTDATYPAGGKLALGCEVAGTAKFDDFGGGAVVTTAPSAPQSPSATAGNTQNVLNWTAPSSDGGSAITGYKIYRSLTTGTETLFASPAGTGTTYTNTGLTNGTAYFYKISAVNAIGESALSTEVSATPTAGATAPTAPLNPIATPGDSQVALTWTVPASNGGSAITGYKIYRGVTSGGETLFAPSPIIYPSDTLFPSDTAPGALVAGTSYTDSTAVNGTNYCYKISAVNAIGESVLSTEVCATPASPATVPSVAQSLVATAGNAQVSLGWSAPSSNGGSAITGYKIYRSTTTNTETLLASPAGTGTSYVDSTAVNGTTYFYKVTAVNAVGESALSNESFATPTAGAPPPQPTRTFKRIYGPGLLSNVAATLYTVPASTTTIIRHVHASNPTGSPVNFSLSIGTSAAPTRIWDAQPVPAGDLLDHYQDFTLTAGEIIQGYAGTTSVLNLTIDGYELTLP